MNNVKYSPERAPGREHVPRYPPGFVAIRFVQLVFALIIIGLAAYGISLLPFDGSIFILVVGLFTLILSVYHIAAWFVAPLFNYWAALAVDAFMIIMWLSSFALLASEVATVFSWGYTSYYGYTYGLSTQETIWASALAAASGLGGLEFLLHIISLSISGVAIHRHRAAGLHCMPIRNRTMPGGPMMQQQPGVAPPGQFGPAPPQQQFVPQQQPSFGPQPQPQFMPQQQQPQFAPLPQQQQQFAPPQGFVSPQQSPPPQPHPQSVYGGPPPAPNTYTPTPPPQQAYVQGPPPVQQPNPTYSPQQQAPTPLVDQKTGTSFAPQPAPQQLPDHPPTPEPQQLPA